MDKALEKLFDKLNQEFWNGKLPKIEVQRSRKLGGDYAEYFCPESPDEDVPKKYIIKIAHDLRKKKDLIDTMLHEMAHHYVFINNKEALWGKKIKWHGTLWRNEMRRLGFGPRVTKYT